MLHPTVIKEENILIPAAEKVTWIYRIKIIYCPLQETADSAGSAAKSMLTYNPNAADC